MTASTNEFRAGMRQLAAAVNVISTVHEGRRAGMTATAVISITAEPPQIAVAVNQSNASFAVLVASRTFVVNVLAHDHADLASVFAGANGVKGEERFAAGSWDTLATGAPALAEAVANFDCELVQTVEFSTHTLLVGLVRAVRVSPSRTPLLYIDGTWASLVRPANAELVAYEALVDGVAAAMDAAVATAGSPRDRLSRFTRDFVELNVAALETMRRFHSQETFVPATRLVPINARKRQVEAKMRALLIQGMEEGDFGVSDPHVVADAIIGLLSSLHRSPNLPEPPNSKAVVETFVALVDSMVGATRREPVQPGVIPVTSQ